MKINKTISKEKFLDNFFKNHPRGSWLDLGCVSDDPENLIKNNHWLHAILIRESNNNCLGVDFQQENVKKLQEKGYNIIWGDVEKPLEITEKFDYIFIGELIEHVTNVHALLKNCKERLKDGGKVILTTPNAYNYRNILRQFLLNRVTQHPQHVNIYDYETMKNTLEREGFEMVDFLYVTEFAPNIFLKFIDWFFYLFKGSFCSNLIVVSKLK